MSGLRQEDTPLQYVTLWAILTGLPLLRTGSLTCATLLPLMALTKSSATPMMERDAMEQPAQRQREVRLVDESEARGDDPRVLGQRLQEARKARGLTQQVAADALRVARTTVVAMEQGARRVQSEELIALAGLYGRSVSELLRPGPVVPGFGIQFRAIVRPEWKADLADDIQSAVAEFRRWCANYVYLETLAAADLAPAAPRPYDVSGLSPDQAGELAARSERNRLGLGDGPIGNLRAVLEGDRGLRVFLLDLPAKVAGMFSYTREYGPCVAVNRKHPRERRTWTLAHEHGHFVTSPYEADVLTAAGPGVSRSERTADTFAKHFLLPTEAVTRRHYTLLQEEGGQTTPASIIALADYFGVSFQAMMLRLEELGHVSRGTWQMLDHEGFRVREAQTLLGYPRTAPIESEDAFPRRYLFLAIRAFAAERIGEGQFAELLATDRLSVRDRVQELLRETGAEDVQKLASLLSRSLS